MILYPPQEVKRVLLEELKNRVPMFAGMAQGPAAKAVDALYARGFVLVEVKSSEVRRQAQEAFAAGRTLVL